MIESTKFLVVGGGVAGLCAAHLLSEKFGPDAVLLLEAGDRPGGNARTDRIDGYVCDWGPNGFLDKEPRTLEWAAALGLDDELIRADELAAHRFILRNGRLVEIVPPPRFFLAPLLSVRGRLRLCREPFIKRRMAYGPETVWDFAARRIGPEAADTLVSAMVLGVFGGDARKLSLEHCFPTMAAMERDYGSLVRAMIAKKREGSGGGPVGPAGTLTTFRGGIGALTERAAERLGSQIRLNTSVSRMEQTVSGYRVSCANGVSVQAQAVVLAAPAYRTAELLGEVDHDAGVAIRKIKHAPIAVVCTGYPRDRVRHDMNGFGFLIPPNQRKRALGCIWTSSIFPDFAPAGKVFLRTMVGGALDPAAMTLSDTELLDVVAADVHPVMGIDTAPEFVQIFRHPHGIPQYHLNHGEILEAVQAAETRHPNLAFIGNAYHGVSLNDCVVQAHRAAERIAGNL